MRGLLVAFVLLFTAQCSLASYRCYDCNWDAYRPNENQFCEKGKDVPDAYIKNNCDMCMKEQHKTKDVLYVERKCYKMDTVDLGRPKAECTDLPFEKGEKKLCYCGKELCNTSSPVRVHVLLTAVPALLLAVLRW